MKDIFKAFSTGAERAWERIFSTFTHPATGLIYDYITSDIPGKRFKHLPTPEEIHRNTPNPCGWGTGQEDCVLNGGLALDAACRMYAVTGGAVWKQRAEAVFSGLELAATAHGVNGFVARGISPFDGKSCYINSSRDQFTLFVYGVWRFFRSECASPEMKRRAGELLTAVSDYCEKTVTEENSFNLLRLDGKKAMVCGMDSENPHELMRLPMFHCAAWTASGDGHKRELYLKYAMANIDKNLAMTSNRYWWDIELSQMQFSLALLHDEETVPELKNKYALCMRRTAEITLAVLEKEIEKQSGWHGDGSELNINWRAGKFVLREEIPGTLVNSALWEGTPYMMPQPDMKYFESMSLIRAAGNLALTLLLTPGSVFPETAAERLSTFAGKIDTERFASAYIIPLLDAYAWSCPAE